MLTTGTQNLPEPLARVQAAYHGTARRPSDRDLRIMELYADFAGEALRQARLRGLSA
jgi:hypothetical protein